MIRRVQVKDSLKLTKQMQHIEEREVSFLDTEKKNFDLKFFYFKNNQFCIIFFFSD